MRRLDGTHRFCSLSVPAGRGDITVNILCHKSSPRYGFLSLFDGPKFQLLFAFCVCPFSAVVVPVDRLCAGVFSPSTFSLPSSISKYTLFFPLVLLLLMVPPTFCCVCYCSAPCYFVTCFVVCCSCHLCYCCHFCFRWLPMLSPVSDAVIGASKDDH